MFDIELSFSLAKSLESHLNRQRQMKNVLTEIVFLDPADVVEFAKLLHWSEWTRTKRCISIRTWCV
jgi:hypothetical protein